MTERRLRRDGGEHLTARSSLLFIAQLELDLSQLSPSDDLHGSPSRHTRDDAIGTVL